MSVEATVLVKIGLERNAKGDNSSPVGARLRPGGGGLLPAVPEVG